MPMAIRNFPHHPNDGPELSTVTAGQMTTARKEGGGVSRDLQSQAYSVGDIDADGSADWFVYGPNEWSLPESTQAGPVARRYLAKTGPCSELWTSNKNSTQTQPRGLFRQHVEWACQRQADRRT
jgi:hypothetical protein